MKQIISSEKLTGIRLTNIEADLVAAECKRRGLGISATIRQMLREWQEMRGMLTTTVNLIPTGLPTEENQQ